MALDRITTFELKFCCGPRQVHLLDTKLSKIVLGGTAALRVLSGVGGGTSF
jgi:hypothetical protein